MHRSTAAAAGRVRCSRSDPVHCAPAYGRTQRSFAAQRPGGAFAALLETQLDGVEGLVVVGLDAHDRAHAAIALPIIEDAAANVAELTTQATAFAQRQVPVLRALGVV